MLIAFVVASEEVANSFCKFLVSLIILSVELLMVLHEVCIQLIILVIASTFVSTSNPQLSSSASFLRLNVLSSLN